MPYLCRTARSAFPTVAGYGHRSATVENCRHNTSADGSHAYATKRLPANIHHASALEVARAVRGPEVYLTGLA